MTAPILITERLTLRPPQEADFEAFAAFCASERSKWVGGPSDRDKARTIFNGYLADLASGHPSYLHIVLSETGVVIGRAGIRRADQPPEPEIAYSLYADQHEGHGYATEAATAVRDWAYDTLGLHTVVSYIEPENAASQAVASRIGARPDTNAPRWDKHPNLIIYRHRAPEERS
ncbi:Protein N-acetyltransferase, RimJ/RimL family [Aliiroseovarius crassostreae]|uniref:N-acetyltransferase domain-containing protein n=1 Tax=Aliiroseovarius crassostreae TaxID=154981 RepID=A0A0P7I587_9RHOB|nr:GNAT family N-acetyltransferase [Aliiroseovarius crassostreae]KPN64418.1 hypothetical protein AKJ29_17545 [Aliiroseovarius crassostreae]SFU34516.1 Protein N-acetyltransferase, RimJ/RimL family [Aliiroseovarius crassostreae]